MLRNTFFWILICVILGAATAVVGWWLYEEVSQDKAVIEANDPSLSIGLPVGKTESELIIRSDSAILWDSESQVILFEQAGFKRRPIASITKLMTAMVAMDYGLDWEKEVQIEPDEYVIGGKLMMQSGEAATVRDLFYASLMSSANNATLAYVRSLDVPGREFVQAMNRKAIELGLEQTEFVEVTGLDHENTSTAYEVARIAEEAWNNYPLIAEVSSTKEYTFTFKGSDREHVMRNSNKLITNQEVVFSGSKTGYLNEAGSCLVVKGVGVQDKIIVVVLGIEKEWENNQDILNLLEKTKRL
jgi:D-alanyl-D-alanine carboxypeptidase